MEKNRLEVLCRCREEAVDSSKTGSPNFGSEQVATNKTENIFMLVTLSLVSSH